MELASETELHSFGTINIVAPFYLKFSIVSSLPGHKNMNLSHPSNVATVFSILTSNGFDGEHDDDDDDDDKGDYFHPEAPALIKIVLLYEQPQGTGLHINLTLDPALTTESLKIDLANMINVPAEFMKLIHLNTVLEDDKSLCNQSVEPNATIVLRDSRLTYNFP